jgi:hypothetical protein
MVRGLRAGWSQAIETLALPPVGNTSQGILDVIKFPSAGSLETGSGGIKSTGNAYYQAALLLPKHV